jgi:hypothetical protein
MFTAELLPGGPYSCDPPSKTAWISLDYFGRIVIFQWVTANPNKNIFLALDFAQTKCKTPHAPDVGFVDSAKIT